MIKRTKRKRNLYTLIVGLIALAVALPVHAQDHGWRPLERHADGTRIFALEGQEVARLLGTEDTITIALPDPEGKTHRFRLRASGVMSPALAARYPRLRAYAGQAIDDASIQARVELTPEGLHAQVRRGARSYWIAPLPEGRQYQVWRREEQETRPRARLCGAPQAAMPSAREDWLASGRFGDSLRVFRLAVAAAGEYTRFHGGTVEQALAAIVRTINRVNGIFERDLAVRLVLVEGIDRIIYANPETDPFSRNNETRQSQETIDAVIGPENYDIGHTFGVGGLSRTAVGSACVPGRKAFAYTGIGAPVGDPFDVDYVAHEIGHQLGANHIFNRCGREQGAQPFEPGGGATIMSWSGLCGADDIAHNSDDYFHLANILEIQQFIAEGAAQGCPTILPLDNRPPRVETPKAVRVIPIDTPFELEGWGEDEDDDALLFVWEQFDRGPSTPPDQPLGNAPLFRSFPPTPAPQRAFPQWSDILEERSTIGEILPTYEREMTFRLSARDQRGGLSWDERRLRVSGRAGPFRVFSPPTNPPWMAGQAVRIEWDPANTPLSPVNARTVSIFLSADGGASFSLSLARGVPNTGQTSVTLPDTLRGDNFRLMVRAEDNVFFAVNRENFTIQGATVSSDNAAAFPAPEWSIAPNPGAGHFWLRGFLGRAQFLRLDIFSADGRRLRGWELGPLPAGAFETPIELNEFPNGLYLLRLAWENGTNAGMVRLAIQR